MEKHLSLCISICICIFLSTPAYSAYPVIIEENMDMPEWSVDGVDENTMAGDVNGDEYADVIVGSSDHFNDDGDYFCLNNGILAIRLLEVASEKQMLKISKEWVKMFARRQIELFKDEKETIAPDEIMLFFRKNFLGNDNQFQTIVQNVLYEKVDVKKSVKRNAIEINETLKSILAFCAAKPNTAIAPKLSPTLKNEKIYEIQTNIKVGGILTTNYDNLLEGAFHTKYRRNLLKPVGRPSSKESELGRNLIPVYHIHGYIGYQNIANKNNVTSDSMLIIGEDDYFKAFYDPLGFGNYTAMSFLNRFPCIFIGSAMADKNLRRFLFHLVIENKSDVDEPHHRKFAILKSSEKIKDEFIDSILLNYGVKTVWIKEYSEIYNILKQIYSSIEGVDWDYAYNYTWP